MWIVCEWERVSRDNFVAFDHTLITIDNILIPLDTCESPGSSAVIAKSSMIFDIVLRTYNHTAVVVMVRMRTRSRNGLISGSVVVSVDDFLY